MLGRDPMWQLLYQQGKRIVGMIYSHSVQLDRLIKKMQSKVISRPQPSRECGLLYTLRAVGWKLCT